MSATMTTVIPQRRVMSLQTAPPRATPSKPEPRIGQYVLGQTLGEGEFGKVKLGWPSKRSGNRDDVQVAIKLIRRESLGVSRSRMNKIEREINVLNKVNHPNIVKCHEVIETERYIGIILEYASGGELFDYILAHRYLKDPIASKLFAQLVSAVQYLHVKGIVHRDLKLENLLLDRNRNIIVTDFGFANTFDPASSSDDIDDMRKRESSSKGVIRGDLMQTSCGSPCYAAPELVVSDGSYCGRKVDVWSCGVILYAMLAGYLPFDDDPSNPEGDNITLLYKYIVNTPLTFPEYISPLARDLLRKILVADPRSRASLENVKSHPWLAQHQTILTRSASVSRVSLSSQGQDMIRSSSERPAAHSSAALPAFNHLVPTGFAKNTSMGPPSMSSPTHNKRHTVQIEYDSPFARTTESVPKSHSRSSSQTQAQVESLSIAAAPVMARSASHTGAQPVSPPTVRVLEGLAQNASTGPQVNRGTSRLPAPTNKPRPTSYHPTYRRPEEQVEGQQRVPSDPSTSTPMRPGSNGSAMSASSWTKGTMRNSKTASPRSTNQNVTGELYRSQGTGLESSATQANLLQASLPVGEPVAKKSHRRNSSSISSVFGKLWPSVATAQEVKNARRASRIQTPAAMESIGESSSATAETPGPSKAEVPHRWQSSMTALSSRLSIGSRPVADATHGGSETHGPEAGDNAANLVRSKPIIKSATGVQDRSSTSAARRVMDFFTARRKDRGDVKV